MGLIVGVINKNGAQADGDIIDKISHSFKRRVFISPKTIIADTAAFGAFNYNNEPKQLHVENNEFILLANARLYNKESLFSQLNLDNKDIDILSEAALLLEVFKKWGYDCINYIEGEYVFAVWDKIKKRLFLAADHIGFRPLFYYNGAEQFVFCSEISGIIEAKTTTNYFNDEYLIDYHFRQGNASQTYNKEVFALCGGNTLDLYGGKICIRKYWNLAPTGKYSFQKDVDWHECLKELLYLAIEKRIDINEQTGVTLSGGLDSTSVACILSQILAKKNKPLFAFSSVLPLNHVGIEEDERKYVQLVNEFCPNIIQTYIEPQRESPFFNVEAAFEKSGELPNSFFYVDDAILSSAKEKNIKNLFTGYGGDFWASWQGKRIIYQLINEKKYNQAWQLLNNYSKTRQKSLLHVFKSEYINYSRRYNLFLKWLKPLKTDWQKQSMLKDDFLAKYPNQTRDFGVNTWATFIQQYINTGKAGRVEGMLANRNAFYGMGSSNPMLDKDILEFLADTPLHLFNQYGNTRELMRNAMKGIIPESIRLRTDKQPYAPGYHKKILENKALFTGFTEAEEYRCFFDKYFDEERLIGHFGDIMPQKGFTPKKDIVGIRAIQAGISLVILKKLREENYIF